VGRGLSTRDDAPFDDPAFTIWGVTDIGRDMIGRRFDAFFELHDESEITEASMQWYARQTKPIYMQAYRSDIQASITFPLPCVVKMFGRYFTSTVAYMIAMAMLHGCEDLHLYGVDMGRVGKRLATPDPYGYQRSCCEYLLGFARGRGVNVYVPEKSALLKAPALYGYEEKG